MVSAPANKGQWRINPRYDDHMERRREMIEQKGQRLVNMGRGDHVKVFQHQDVSVRKLAQSVEESRERVLQGRRLKGRGRRKECLACRQHIGPETHWIVIACVE